MKPYSHLTPRGQTRRLRTLAKEALTQYDLDVTRLSLLSDSFNHIFRVDSSDGKKFVLRVNYPNLRTPRDIQSEMLWLDALSRETDVSVTTPLRTKDGRLFVTVSVMGVPEPRHCALFYWIDGRIPSKPSLATVQKVGTVMAKLHDHADIFNPDVTLTPLRNDKTWSFGTPERVYSDAPDPLFTPHRRAVLQNVAKRVEEHLASLYRDPTGLRFLHADLHMWNIKLHRGRVHVFDFDDSMNCYPIQDMGIALYYYEMSGNGAAVRDAFRRGYTALRDWPESFPGELDLCIAHRMLDLLSFLVRDFGEAEIERFLKRRLPRIETWLEKR